MWAKLRNWGHGRRSFQWSPVRCCHGVVAQRTVVVTLAETWAVVTWAAVRVAVTAVAATTAAATMAAAIMELVTWVVVTRAATLSETGAGSPGLETLLLLAAAGPSVGNYWCLLQAEPLDLLLSQPETAPSPHPRDSEGEGELVLEEG